jgi:MFS family permease
MAVILFIAAYSTLTNYSTYFAFAKFDIDDGVDLSAWNQRFQVLHEVGYLPGLVVATSLMKYHRILPFYVATIFLAVAVAVMMIDKFWAFILGRMISGFAIGMHSVSMQRIIEEYSPMQSFQTIYSLVMTIANVSTTFIAIGLITWYPVKTETGELTPEFRQLTKESHYWRMMLILPLCFSLAATCVALYVIRHDTPKSLLSKDKPEKALKSIQ